MIMSVLRIKFFTEFDREDVLFSRLCIKCPLSTRDQLLEFTNSMLGSNGKNKAFYVPSARSTLGSVWLVKVDMGYL